MSVRSLTTVWDRSKHSGTDLLMLLAIADFADDGGHAFPSVAGLARKCRMSPRNANYILAMLQESGELRVLKNQGMKGTNVYQLVFAAMNRDDDAPLQATSGVKRSAGVKDASGVKGTTSEAGFRYPEAGFPKPLKPIAPEPSLNRQEPSQEAATPPPKLPRCPHRTLLTLFAERLPELPRPRYELWAGSKDADNMAQRWKWFLTAERENGKRYATTADEAVACFGLFFDKVAASDFLSGRAKDFQASLEWLMTPRNFTKVIQDNYKNREVHR